MTSITLSAPVELTPHPSVQVGRSFRHYAAQVGGADGDHVFAVARRANASERAATRPVVAGGKDKDQLLVACLRQVGITDAHVKGLRRFGGIVIAAGTPTASPGVAGNPRPAVLAVLNQAGIGTTAGTQVEPRPKDARPAKAAIGADAQAPLKAIAILVWAAGACIVATGDTDVSAMCPCPSGPPPAERATRCCASASSRSQSRAGPLPNAPGEAIRRRM